ncbi:MAG TPA: ATP-binding cassette domain-containing protein [Fimbriimonadaceae bacterium]|nr:ATP-binding cassette domain-containing protein [Fimbriimonadaceae bacterium]HRJ95767.1 ATP-binding cassette domain-containing protein [Fimbriimonadaceae bacterium]
MIPGGHVETPAEPAADRAAVSVRGLSVQFGENLVLRDVSFDVQPGEIMAIMGSSGGGKTTLLRCIAGLLTPTAGLVTVEGLDVAKNPEAVRRQLGLVFQRAALFDYLDVRENILFGVRRQRRLSRGEADDLVDRKLGLVALQGSADLMPAELSGGMAKRVALARALAMEPKVLLYDEPTSGLDPVTAYSIDQLIVQTRERLGMTSIVVSHDVNSVFRTAEKIAFLSKGELLFFGTIDEFRKTKDGSIVELVRKAQAETLQNPS